MSGIAKNLSNKLGGNQGTSTTSGPAPSNTGTNEPMFHILPHPAKTNDPADLQPGGGLRHGGPFDAFHNPGPFIPSEEQRQNFPQPLSSDELKVQQAKLNQEK